MRGKSYVKLGMEDVNPSSYTHVFAKEWVLERHQSLPIIKRGAIAPLTLSNNLQTSYTAGAMSD